MSRLLVVPRWIVLVYALGMAAGFFYEPLGLLTLGWLIWYQRARVQETVKRETERLMAWKPHDRPLWAWLPLGVIGVMVLWVGGVPPLDDLSRHMGAYRHHFDYSYSYLYSDILHSVTFSPWFGFEWLLGVFYEGLWRALGWLPVQWSALNRNLCVWGLMLHAVIGFIFYLFGIIFVPVFRRAFQHHPMPHAMTGIAITLMLSTGLGLRLALGRPEMFLMLGMFAAWRLPPRIWVILMMALQPLYWLSWLYSIGVLLLNQWSWRQRCVAMVLILSTYILFWQTYCGLDAVVHFVKMVGQALHTRIVHAGENTSPLTYIFSSMGIVSIGLIIAALYRWDEGLKASERNAVIGLAVLWLLTNQFRYSIYAIPCLVYLWAHQRPRKADSYKEGHRWRLLVALGLSITFCLKTLPLDGFMAHVPLFKSLPSDGRVLTFFNPSTFVLPTLYPGVKVAPAMEVGFTNVPLQQLLRDRFDERGRNKPFDCQRFTKEFNQFNFIVDTANDGILPGRTPECLKLEETYNVWRLWRIIPSTYDKRG